jgi:small nuclear ribonucleoprotein (snRNP)-like protein
MLVELKNGETLNGHLVTCDTWMNLTLKEVVQTSPVSSPSPTVHMARLYLREQELARLIQWLIGWRQVLQITGGLCQGQQRMFYSP